MSQHLGKDITNIETDQQLRKSGREDRDGRTMDEEQITNDSCGTS